MASQRFLKAPPVQPNRHVAAGDGGKGLVVFTQDFRVARKLVDEGARVEQEYIVEVAGAIREGGLALLNHGRLQRQGNSADEGQLAEQNRLRFALKGVKPGQIAHMCRMVELKVVA